MAMFNKRFLLGLGVGIALTFVGLDLWAAYLQRTTHREANPLLLASLRAQGVSALSLPKSSERFPQPWLPEPWGQPHEDWSIRPLRGKPLRLSEFKGKVVFLNFWSTG